MPPRPELIRVRVEPHGLAALKVAWESGHFPRIGVYSVDRGLIEAKAAEVRKRLLELVQEVRKAKPPAPCGGPLKRLAEAGSELYEALFTPEAGKPIEPDKVKKWLLKHQQNYQITFNVGSRVHVPWGLIYDADPGDLTGKPADTAIDLYRDFWCLKYRVSTLYSRIEPTLAGDAIPGPDFQTVAVLNKKVVEALAAKLQDPAEQKALDDFVLKKSVYRKEELFQIWKNVADKHGLLYFLCHANGTSLELAADDLLSINDIRLRLKRKSAADDETACVVFLNGCATAVGESQGGFLEATGGHGFLGFIGTETKVPDLFACRFGLAFLRAFLHTGAPLIEVMDRLRADHWPLSLLYSIYCYPQLSVAPLPGGAPPPQPVNLSAQDLGTGELEVRHGCPRA
jgi:hypothetical protein